MVGFKFQRWVGKEVIMPLKQNKINILYIHPVSRWIGGGETGLLDLLANLDQDIFNPIVIIPHEGVFGKRINDLNIKTYFLPLRRWESFETKVTLFYKIYQLIHIIHKEDPQIIHAHSHETTPFAILTSRLKGIPVISHIRLDILKDTAKKYLVHKADVILTKSEWQREEILKITKSEVINTGDGFDFKRYNYDARGIIRYDMRNKLGINNNALVIISVARFEERKNFELSVKAMSILQKKDVYLLLVGAYGNGPYEKKIKKLVAEKGLEAKIRIIPYCQNVFDYLLASDIFLILSKKEGLSRAAIEGMIAGIPILGTKIPGNQELIIEGKNGFFIDDVSPCILAEKIDMFHQENSILLKMGAESRKMAEERYMIHGYCSRIETIYINLASNLNNRWDKYNQR